MKVSAARALWAWWRMDSITGDVMNKKMNQVKGGMLVGLGLLMFVWSAVSVHGLAGGLAPDRRIAFSDVPIPVSGDGVIAVRPLPPESATVDPASGRSTPRVEVKTRWSDGHVLSYRVAARGAHSVCLVQCPAAGPCDGECPGSVEVLFLVTRGAAVWAILGSLALLLGLPFLLRPGADKPWLSILSEPIGGLSLARVQFLIWLVPGVVIYSALTITTRSFMPLDSTLVMLLGMSGATTVLGSAANPKAAASKADEKEVHAARLGDVLEDWTDRGDISRYQCLLLSLLGAVILLVSFSHSFTVPAVPPEFVALIGASQVTYLGVKQVKTNAMDG